MTARLLSALSLAFISFNALAQTPHYAPTPPPTIYKNEKPKLAGEPSTPIAQAVTQYSIGDPTDEEQMHLELINRARADANAEALRLIALAQIDPEVADQFIRAWNVDTNLMKQQFSIYAAAPPLSFNAKLINAARGHSQYQFDNAIQAHSEPDPLLASPGLRATDAGYLYSSLGENVFLNATSVQQGHAAFDVDWGPGPGGMQTPPGHRDTIHNSAFVEVGIGVVKGLKTVNGNDAGPQVVTEDFGAPRTAATYITGVAFYDINGNNFYDLGEGLPGVRVTIDGVPTFAITSTSGGYSIPVARNATYTVRFNANGYPESSSSAAVATANKKIDFKPAYTTPVPAGPDIAYVDIDNIYNATALPGATGYRARMTQLTDIPIEGAEGPLDFNRLTITTFGDYPFISTAKKASGAQSFHFGHMVDNGSLDPQILEFNLPIQVFANARVDFKSLMAFGGDAQIARFEVSEDDGATWTTLWSQAGNGSAEAQFNGRSADLSAYDGKRIRVRFNYDFIGGGAAVLPHVGDPNFDRTGWYLDDIAFTNAQEVFRTVESPVLPNPRFAFHPTFAGTFLLEFQPIVGSRTFQYGPAKTVNVEFDPPSVSFSKSLSVTATTVSIVFDLTGGSAGPFVLESAPSVAGPWSTETQAQITFNAPSAGRFTVTTPRNGDFRFYRLVVN
jgi:uncharacterized protein YkwD